MQKMIKLTIEDCNYYVILEFVDCTRGKFLQSKRAKNESY